MGWTSGLPASRLSLNTRNSVLKLGGPANNMPSVVLAMSFAPVICRQLCPHTVDRVEERTPRLLGLGLVDQVGDPRRQVGVLDSDGRAVAAGEVLEAVHQRRVDPATAGRGHHVQVLALEAARALEVLDRKC